MTFFAPNTEVFPLLNLARYAIREGGALPAVLNGANEVAVAAFLEKKLSFVGIFHVVSETVKTLAHTKDVHTLDGILSADKQAREMAEALIANL